jgi:hypothetical protein
MDDNLEVAYTTEKDRAPHTAARFRIRAGHIQVLVDIDGSWRRVQVPFREWDDIVNLLSNRRTTLSLRKKETPAK